MSDTRRRFVYVTKDQAALLVYLGIMFQLFDIAVYAVLVVAGRDVWKATNGA